MTGRKRTRYFPLEDDQKKIRLLGFLLLFLLINISITSPKPFLATIYPKKVHAEKTQDFLVSSVSASIFQFISPTQIPPPVLSSIPQEEPKPYCVDVPILMYHHIEPMPLARQQGHDQLTVDRAVFESQLQYLIEQGYISLSVSDLVEVLQERLPLPEKSVVLTFDDGYDDIYYFAYPLLEKYNLKGNFFIATGLIETTDYLQWIHIKDMDKSARMFFYNLTAHHIQLPAKDKTTITHEISQAREVLKEHVNDSPAIFAYPYGANDEATKSVLRELGIQAALTTESGTVHCVSDLLGLKRIRIGNTPLSTYNL